MKRHRLYQAAPYAPDPWWYTLGHLLLELLVLLSLIIGAPFLLWLLMVPK